MTLWLLGRVIVDSALGPRTIQRVVSYSHGVLATVVPVGVFC